MQTITGHQMRIEEAGRFSAHGRKGSSPRRSLSRVDTKANVFEGARTFFGAMGRILFGLALFCLVTSCASDKAGMSSPELPAKHWLDDSPGIPVENKEEYDAAVPNLYNPDKTFDFEDSVYLTIQQSPLLVNSAVEIEIKRLAHTTSMWQYLPEPHMTLKISQNITNFNKGRRNISSDYGTMQYEVGFYAPFPNPMVSYFNSKAQGMMTGIAISTHRKAVGEAIYKIASAYLQLQAQENILQARRVLVPVAKELTEYWKHVESVEGNQGASLSLALQHEREAELALEQAENEETILRTNLKVLAGLDAHQRFQVDASRAHEILKGFNGQDLRWEDAWVETEDNLLLRAQIKLADYQIMLSWAQYVPRMNMAVNQSPPRGQSQPSGGVTDRFFHFTLDFPLVDWGRRYREVQTSRMGKAQAFHSMTEKRFDYQNQWILAEQNTTLALTNLKLAQNRYQTARMQYDEARIAFEHGLGTLPDVAKYQEAMVAAQITYIQVELNYRLAQLKWMYISGRLQKRFLGLPDRELDELVGGQNLNAATSGALPPDPDDEQLFPREEKKPDVEDNRLIGRAMPVELGTNLETEGESSEGESSKGESSKGESSKGESSKGESSEGASSEGESSEQPAGESPSSTDSKSGDSSKPAPESGDRSASARESEDLSTTPTVS